MLDIVQVVILTEDIRLRATHILIVLAELLEHPVKGPHSEFIVVYNQCWRSTVDSH